MAKPLPRHLDGSDRAAKTFSKINISRRTDRQCKKNLAPQTTGPGQ
jgi:hypothetical protein